MKKNIYLLLTILCSNAMFACDEKLSFNQMPNTIETAMAALKSFSGESEPFEKGKVHYYEGWESDIDPTPVRFERKFFSSDDKLQIFALGLLGNKKELDIIAKDYVENTRKLLEPYYNAHIKAITNQWKEFDPNVIEYEQNRIVIPRYKKAPYEDSIEWFKNYSTKLFRQLDFVNNSQQFNIVRIRHDEAISQIDKDIQAYDACISNPCFQVFNDTRLFLYLTLNQKTDTFGYVSKQIKMLSQEN